LFILDQKNEQKVLNIIARLFSKAINKKATIRTLNKPLVAAVAHAAHKNNNMYRLSLYCNDKKRIISDKIIHYFNSYKLKTTKNKSFDI